MTVPGKLMKLWDPKLMVILIRNMNFGKFWAP